MVMRGLSREGEGDVSRKEARVGPPTPQPTIRIERGAMAVQTDVGRIWFGSVQ